MGKPSLCGVETEIGKQILEDFKNFKTTGFEPWADVIGGKNHYLSSERYKIVSSNAFRNQAKRIAEKACKEIPACDLPDDVRERLQKEVDSENQKCAKNSVNQTHDDDDDEDYELSCDESCSEDGLEGFDEIELGELQISREPFISQYPASDKVLAIFPLDGDVHDNESTHFEFINDNTAIQRLGKVPKERESCVSLIGLPTDKPSKIGFSAVDLFVVDAEIQKRLRANNYNRDKYGNIWEVRAVLQLPFKCHPQLYGKNGKPLTTFRMQSNGRGFSWGYFWLLAWNPPEAKPPKRLGAKKVKTMSVEESSVWTEKTFVSNKKMAKKKFK